MMILLASLALLATDVSPPDTNVQCGAYCLYCSLKALDFPVKSLADVQSRLGPETPSGYSLGKLDEVARSYGAHTLGVQTTVEHLEARDGRFACIAYVNDKHFLLIADVANGRASVVDPPREYVLPVQTLAARWDGTALLISPSPLEPEPSLTQSADRKWLIVGTTVLVLVAVAVTVWRRRGARAAG